MDIIEKIIEQINIGLPVSKISNNPLIIVDILIVSLIIYWIYKLLRNTRAVRILYGLLILIIIMYISSLLNLTLLHWLLQIILTVIIVAIPIVFQPEFRNALERIGRTGIKAGTLKDSRVLKILNPVLDSVKVMSRDKTGGIIAVQRKTGLSDYAKTGTMLNANISKSLLLACFISGSPFHDGAVIISNTSAVAQDFEMVYDFYLINNEIQGRIRELIISDREKFRGDITKLASTGGA